MRNKEILLEILYSIKNNWKIADGIIYMLEKGLINDNQINDIIKLLEKIFEEIKFSFDLEKINKSKLLFKKIKEMELEENKNMNEIDLL